MDGNIPFLGGYGTTPSWRVGRPRIGTFPAATPENRYSMRRKDKEIIDIVEIESIIDTAKVCRIAMVDDGFPYLVPMCFARQGKALFLHSALKGKKIDVLSKTPEVCFEIDQLMETIGSDEPCGWSIRYQSVIGFGRAVFIEDKQEKKKALDIIFERYAGNRGEFPETKVRGTAVIRIDIDSMTGKASGF